MDIHKNARLTPFSREALAQRVLGKQLSLKAAAAAFNVSPKTAAKWVCRYRQEGRDGMADYSSRPRTSPRCTVPLLLAQVETLRRQRWPGFRIAQHTALSRSTVSRILRRRGLNRLRALDPAPPPRRYEYSQPGGLLHLDIKALGRFHRPQFRHHPRGSRRSSGAGWEYLHVAIDDHSRIAFALLLPDQSHQSALAFLRAALDYFTTLGLSIRRVMTDNGGCYRSGIFAAASSNSNSAISSPVPTLPAPTVRPNVSSRPPCVNGPTASTTLRLTIAASACRPGCSSTTISAPMLVSITLHPSAD